MPSDNFIETAVSHPQVNHLVDLALSLYKSTHIDGILAELVEGVTALYEADHVRLFAYDAVGNEVYTRIQHSGLFEELKFTVSEDSLAGYTAFHKKIVALDDVRDPAALSRYPRLRYDSRYEERTGVRIRSIISVPLLDKESNLVGLVQLINPQRPVHAYRNSLQALINIAKLVATAVFHHDERQRRATKFDLLLEEGVVSPEEIDRAIQSARKNADDPIQGDPVSVLMNEFGVPEKGMQASLSRYYLTDFLPYDKERIVSPDLLKGFNADYFRRHFVFPIELDGDTLTLVASDPFQTAAIRELKQIFTAKHCRIFVGYRKDILRYIEDALGGAADEADDQARARTSRQYLADGSRNKAAGAGDGSDAGSAAQTEEEKDAATAEEANQMEDILDEQAPLVVQQVNKLILEAYKIGASDIHVEPGLGRGDTVVRYRKDGACYEHARVPAGITPALINRIKVMSGLRLEEHRFPQSGKIRIKYGDFVIELRVEVTPTVGRKEHVVMRILAGGKFLSIDDLDLSEANRTALMGMIAKPYGILLAVGPTGSGKTTTLHSILHHLNAPEKKIWTVEDPVEITQPGLCQVQVNLNIKPEPFDFAKAMRSFLRADPDIIMVGEMRDKETANIAVEASLTGHLVLSTLHTNSAPETVTRLIQMGIDPLNLADSLLGVLAQRLVRVLCKDCKKAYTPDTAEIQKMSAACGKDYVDACGLDGEVEKLFAPVGCESCSHTGFRGRAGIHELLPATAAVKEAIASSRNISSIRDLALADGMRTLKMDGIRRVTAGQTTIAEVLKVCID
jgi:type II secretory ATPase GspE/PulE/Tfp pilus assembly ATPase PilB-like protein